MSQQTAEVAKAWGIVRGYILSLIGMVQAVMFGVGVLVLVVLFLNTALTFAGYGIRSIPTMQPQPLALMFLCVWLARGGRIA